MVIGFSVDYTIHLGHMFDVARSQGLTTRQEKFDYSIRKMGETVLAGAITTAGSTVFLLACQLTFFTAMGTLIILTVAYSLGYSLLFFMRGSGVDFCGALASRVAPTASSRRESRIDGAEALLAQAFAPRGRARGPRRRHLPLPEGPQVRVLPARVDSQFLRRASARKVPTPIPTYPLVVNITLTRDARSSVRRSGSVVWLAQALQDDNAIRTRLR